MIDGLMDTLTKWLLTMPPGVRTITTWGMAILMPVMLGVAWYAIASTVNRSIRHVVTSILERSIRTDYSRKKQEQKPARLNAEQLSKAASTIIGAENIIGWLKIVGMLMYVAVVLFLGVKMNMMASIVL